MKFKFDFEFKDLKGEKLENALPANELLAMWLTNIPTKTFSPISSFEWGLSLQRGDGIDLTTDQQETLRKFITDEIGSGQSVSSLITGQVLLYMANEKENQKKAFKAVKAIKQN